MDLKEREEFLKFKQEALRKMTTKEKRDYRIQTGAYNNSDFKI